MNKGPWKEIRNDYVNEEDNAIYIDAWRTSNVNEEGKVIAKIDCDTKEVTYLDERARTDAYAQEIIQETIDSLEKIAVTVGYSFGFVPKNELNGIDVELSGMVRYKGENWNLMKAKTYEDSRKIDVLLERYGEYAVKDFKLEPVVMRGVIDMILPGFDKERDSLFFGAYCVIKDGHEIPFDFSGMSWNIEQDGDKLSISFYSGDTPFLKDYMLDECFEDDYIALGYKLQDITAKFLSEATSIQEFYLVVEMDAFEKSHGKELEAEDIAQLGQFELKELIFSDGFKDYPMSQEVLQAYNRQILSLDKFIQTVIQNDELNEIEKIKMIAYKQWDEQQYGNHEGLIEIDNEYGVSIVCPWMDSTGRYEVDPVEEYGQEAFTKFCKELKEKINFVKSKVMVDVGLQIEQLTEIAKNVRAKMENEYGEDLQGKCIEASELLANEIKKEISEDVKIVEGWCQYDDEYYGSEHPWDPHTWVEIGDIYIDTTADQFNHGMYKENDFKKIIVQKGLPHGMRYDEPTWDEYDFDEIDKGTEEWLSEIEKVAKEKNVKTVGEHLGISEEDIKKMSLDELLESSRRTCQFVKEHKDEIKQHYKKKNNLER